MTFQKRSDASFFALNASLKGRLWCGEVFSSLSVKVCLWQAFHEIRISIIPFIVKTEEKKMNRTQKNILTMVLAAMFLAIGLYLPFITGGIPQIGNLLLPMHIPVMFCGLVCGWQYGLIVGFITPLLRSALFGQPTLYPNAVGMAFELATYGAVIGFLYARFRKKNMAALYISLVSAMIAGRVVWGVVRVILLGVAGTAFSWQMFIAGALLNAIPGIILQLVLIPAVMTALQKAGVLRFQNHA